MKHYQDTITGQIYAFYESDDVEKFMLTRRNIPKTIGTGNLFRAKYSKNPYFIAKFLLF